MPDSEVHKEIDCLAQGLVAFGWREATSDFLQPSLLVNASCGARFRRGKVGYKTAEVAEVH